MFERLIDLLLDLSKWLSPVAWIQPWEAGVRITSFGRWQRVRALGPGLHLKLPVFQLIEATAAATTTANLPPQSLTSRDGRAVTAAGVIKYSIKDPTPLFSRLVGREDAIRDVALGAIARAVRARTWDEVVSQADAMEREIRAAIATEAKPWGYKVERFTFSDLGVVRTIRLMQELPQE